MNKRNVLNLGLALALAGLVAVLAYESGNKIPEKSVLITQLTPTDIQKIVIEQSRHHRIILLKTANQWQMSTPYNNQANTLRINKLLALASAKSHARYSVTDINLKQLKLSAPDLTIYFNDTKLIFGTTDAIKGYRYIQIKDTVHLITDRYSHLIRGQATKLLSPALLPENMAITKLALPDLTIQTSDTGWKTRPDNKPTSADQLQQFIDEWRFARALRVSKVKTDANNSSAANKKIVINVYSDSNKPFTFNLTHMEDEIILLRKDIGLRYHFSIEAGERLLNLPSTKPGLTRPN